MTAALPLPGQELLLERFNYDPQSGLLIWAQAPKRNSQVLGKEAGSLSQTGYRSVCVDGTEYQAHRLIWMMQTGNDPGPLQVDHKNEVKSDNSWSNLRLGTHAQNGCNRGAWPGRSLPKGVTAEGARYRARICSDGVTHHLGTFDTPEEAHAAYCEAAQKLHGEFWHE